MFNKIAQNDDSLNYGFKNIKLKLMRNIHMEIRFFSSWQLNYGLRTPTIIRAMLSRWLASPSAFVHFYTYSMPEIAAWKASGFNFIVKSIKYRSVAWNEHGSPERIAFSLLVSNQNNNLRLKSHVLILLCRIKSLMAVSVKWLERWMSTEYLLQMNNELTEI